MPAEQPDPLEKPLDAVFRALPERCAPAALEARVLAELTRLAARPWWRRSYTHWPRAARVATLLFSAGTMAVFAVLSFELMRGPGSEFAARVGARFHEAWITGRVLFEAAQSLIGVIPPLWLIGGAGLLACIYGTLFGLGAAAYRLLWKSPGSFSP